MGPDNRTWCLNDTCKFMVWQYIACSTYQCSLYETPPTVNKQTFTSISYNWYAIVPVFCKNLNWWNCHSVITCLTVLLLPLKHLFSRITWTRRIRFIVFTSVFLHEKQYFTLKVRIQYWFVIIWCGWRSLVIALNWHTLNGISGILNKKTFQCSEIKFDW